MASNYTSYGFLELRDPLGAPSMKTQDFPSFPRTSYLGPGALKGPLRAYYAGTWGARAFTSPRSIQI